MKKLILMCVVSAMFFACGGEKPKSVNPPNPSAEKATNGNPAYDPNRGAGKFTHVDVSPKLDKAKAAVGIKAYDVKCSGCHKLTDEKLVGPGWKGVTERFKAEWIMNFMTNTAEMLDKDPKAQAQLEICLVRMPNQNLSDEEAYGLYEYMRQNDGVK